MSKLEAQIDGVLTPSPYQIIRKKSYLYIVIGKVVGSVITQRQKF